jgi:membrane associated rhomboid family serine protease
MSTGGPDLFVVCKKCGSEVSPYITECPYCGTRLRKRAPKIDREDGDAKPKTPRGRKVKKLSPMRRDEIPGISYDPARRPVVTLGIVLLSLFGFIAVAALPDRDIALALLEDDPYRLATSVFAYGNGWYQLVAVGAIGLFGWRLELRHGPWLVLVLFLLGGAGGNAVASLVEPEPFILGAPGAALGLLAAWAAPDVKRHRRGEEHDADLLGALVMAVLIGAMPIAVEEASAVATLTGGLVGALAGLLLARRV